LYANSWTGLTALIIPTGELKDAMNILIKNANDYQLALFVCRLVVIVINVVLLLILRSIRIYEGENGPVFQDIINNHVIPLAQKTNDSWLESIAYWHLKKYPESLKALLPKTSTPPSATPSNYGNFGGNNNFGFSSIPSSLSSSSSSLTNSGDRNQSDDQTDVVKFNPDIMHLIQYLQTKPILKTFAMPENFDTILSRRAARAYISVGCDVLAIEALLNGCPESFRDTTSDQNSVGYAKVKKIGNKHNGLVNLKLFFFLCIRPRQMARRYLLLWIEICSFALPSTCWQE